MEATATNSPPKGLASKRNTWWGLGAILLFAAGYLQFGLVKSFHAPAAERVNDGKRATFFAFHIEPHGVTSEDFHLYWLRSQRILNRGWSDSLLNRRLEDGGSNYAAPLQALLGMIALSTDGEPVRYSIFMACVFAVGWGALFLVARSYFPARYGTATIVLAVMTAVLFESLQYFFVTPAFGQSQPWPLHRHMRISTLAWTTPFLLSSLIAVTSLWFDLGSKWRSVGLVGAFLLILNCADNWAFAIGFFATGLAWTVLALRWAIARCSGRASSDLSALPLLVLGFLLVALLALNGLLTGSLSGDAMCRSGFGPAWLATRRDAGVFIDILANWFLPWGAITLGAIAGLSLWLSFHVQKLAAFVWLVRFRPTAFDHWRPLAIAITSTVATVCLLWITSWKGLEPFVRNQCYWRIDVLLLFSLAIIFANSLRSAIWIWAKRWPKMARLSGAISIVLLGILLAYHEYRIHWFRVNIVGKEYFLTADAEKLRPWLEKYNRSHKRFSLATLSPELNFLSAYWTNADLLLPSGFPYHTLNSNQKIRHRAVELLRLYNVSSQAWRSFAEPKPISFCDRWRVSRVEAAGLSYIYHLYHRAFTLDSQTYPQWRLREIKTIARSLEAPTKRAVPRPEVILIDNVSRALGEPDLSGYTRKFNGGTVEAWVRTEPAVADRSPSRATALR